MSLIRGNTESNTPELTSNTKTPFIIDFYLNNTSLTKYFKD